MAEVSLNKVFTSFQRADANKDGVLDKKEIAREALKLKQEGKSDEFRLFATFLVGGSDKAGLYPDFFGSNGKTGTDTKISLADLSKLAAADINTTNGSAETISSEDFKTLFGSRAQDSVTIDIDELEEIADMEDTPENDQDFQGFLKKLLPLLFLFGGGQQPGGGGGMGGMNPLLLMLLLGGGSGSNPFSSLMGEDGFNFDIFG